MANQNQLIIQELESEASELLQEIITKENIINPRIELSNAIPKGENYAGVIIKANIKGENKTFSCILKCAPRDPKLRKMIQSEMCFGQEIYFYRKIVPVLENFGQFQALPKCYKIVDIPGQEVIVLEDVRESGYEMKDKKINLDHEHVSLVLKEYGKLHAVSLALKQQKMNVFEELVGGMLDVFSLRTTSMDFYNVFKVIAEDLMVLHDNEKDDNFKNAVNNIKNGIIPFFEKLDEFPRSNGVIVHGDSWSNNMMFTYKDEYNPSVPTNIRFLDFQITKSVPPVIDIVYFLYSNAPEEIINDLKRYLEIYYESLCSHTKLLGSDINELYSFSKLMSDWKEYCNYGFYMALLVTRVMLTEVDDVQDFTDAVEEDKNPADVLVKSKVKNEDLIHKRWRFLTRHMYENNWI